MREEKIIEKLRRYFSGCPYPVALAYLFGSLAKGRTTPLSDMDVGILLREADPQKRMDLYLALLADLIQFLGTDRVDLALLSEEGDGMSARIIVEGVCIYCQDEAIRVRVEKKALDRYLDDEPFARLQRAYVRRRIEQGRMGQGGMEMIDQRVVEERLAYIDRMLGHLQGYRGLEWEQFRRDEVKCHAALYELQTALEAVTDIGNHLIAALNLRRPTERTDVPAILGEAGIIPEALAVKLQQAIGLRNVIVHGYLHLVLEIVYVVIQERLGDIEEFCRAITELLEQRSS